MGNLGLGGNRITSLTVEETSGDLARATLGGREVTVTQARSVRRILHREWFAIDTGMDRGETSKKLRVSGTVTG